ncbi:hypothetical protein, partial [Escherichia coli]|uniref:hypothetical protein n=1 Tax=Escherichia coli TaxID=562 RepID=UPI001BFE4EFD
AETMPASSVDEIAAAYEARVAAVPEAEGAPKHPLARGRHRIAAGQPLTVWRAAEEKEVR